MAAINLTSPAPDGVTVPQNVDFQVDCTQDAQGESGNVAHLQFADVPVTSWSTCRPASGDVQCAPKQWSAQDVAFSIPAVQIKIVDQQTIRVAIGENQDPGDPQLTGFVSNERIIEGFRAPVARAFDSATVGGVGETAATSCAGATEATAGATEGEADAEAEELE